jgi:hypothetical protein
MRCLLAAALVLPCAWIVADCLLVLAGLPLGRLRIAPTAEDWPVVPVFVAGAWLLLRGRQDLAMHSSDALLRIVRTAGMAAVLTGEIWALGDRVRHLDMSMGHLLAAAGFVAAWAASLLLTLRAFWLYRVAQGRVPGYRMRRVLRGNCIADPFVPARAYEECDALVRQCVTPGAYRGGERWLPVARVPRSFWARPLWAHFVL